MALTNVEILRAILPNIGLPQNLDGTYRIGVEDINSDEILAAAAALVIDLAALEVINTAIQIATEASAVDLAAIEVINTAIQTAVQGIQAVDGAVGVAADVDGVRQGQLRYIGEQAALILAAIAAAAVGDYATATHTWPVIANATTVALAANANRLYACFVNDGTEPIYLYLGAAAVMNRGIRLNVGGSYEMSRQIGNLYVGAINGICATGGMTLLVTEGV